MAWIDLLLAGAFGIGFAVALKASFTKALATVIFLICALLSFLLLARAAQTIAIGTADAVWTGIGATGTATLGILIYKEPATALRLIFIAALITSIAGLRYTSPA